MQRFGWFSREIAKFDPNKIQMEDLARSGGAPDEVES